MLTRAEVMEEGMLPAVSLPAIAVTFARIASSAFGGGILALARRELVIERRWVSDDRFLELLSLAQVCRGRT